jgi:uncharacterized protein YprB with RNaseH-like and TPR domain
MAKIVFDIETVGEDFDALDETSQKALTSWLKKESRSEEDYKKALVNIKEGLGFSPLTGQIVALGVYDCDKEKGAVYFQGSVQDKPFEDDGVSFKPMSEKKMLECFWEGAKQYDEFISFNGRAFDVPFLLIRSAVHGIRATKDLMSNRYLSSQKFGAKHVDLLDQLTFYGAAQRKGSLHLWCRAFGIKSPKEDDISGDEVSKFFKAGKCADIARYNAGDLKATKQLYDKWEKYLKA